MDNTAMGGPKPDTNTREAGAERLEEHLRQSQKMEAIERLAGGIAHDFNNLLMVIHGNLEFVQADLPAASPVQRNVQEISHAARRATELIRQLLTFSRQQSMNPVVFDLNTLASTMQEMLGRLLGDEIRMEIRVLSAPLWVRADLAQMELVVMNLAVNARDAMPHGGVLSVETSRGPVEQAADGKETVCARLTVCDTGIGMSPDICAHLFEPYFTTKEIGQGAGLGLSVVYGIIQQHKGRLLVESEPGRGSAFHVCLPEVPPPENSAHHRAATVAPPFPGPATILAVEDEPAVLAVLTRVLQEQGYRVESCTDPCTAATRATALGDSLDLLLADVGMPSLNGAQLAAAVQTACPHVGVIYLTGYPEARLRQMGIDPTRDRVIQKPVFRTLLLEAVSSALQERRRHNGSVASKPRKGDPDAH